MKLIIKESIKGERTEPETTFLVGAKIYEELINPPMKLTVLCICARASLASPSEFFYFVPKYERKSFEKLA